MSAASLYTPAHARASTILLELEALPFAALNKLMPKIEALRLAKHPQVLSARETWLLKKLQSGLPARLRSEHERLNNQRDAGKLTAADRKRAVALAAEIDAHQSQHLQWLMELAGLRRMTVRTLAKKLGLP